MAAKHKVTVTAQPTNHRPTAAERRAAEIASLPGKQAELKRQSAERRAKRAAAGGQPASGPRATGSAWRSNAR
jgi:hypothetical protein